MGKGEDEKEFALCPIEGIATPLQIQLLTPIQHGLDMSHKKLMESD